MGFNSVFKGLINGTKNHFGKMRSADKVLEETPELKR